MAAVTDAELELAFDERIAAIHAHLGLREASRTLGADAVPVIKLERVGES